MSLNLAPPAQQHQQPQQQASAPTRLEPAQLQQPQQSQHSTQQPQHSVQQQSRQQAQHSLQQRRSVLLAPPVACPVPVPWPPGSRLLQIRSCVEGELSAAVAEDRWVLPTQLAEHSCVATWREKGLVEGQSFVAT